MRVVALHFVAGLIIKNDRVVFSAPILRWTIGLGGDALRASFQRKGYTASVIRDVVTAMPAGTPDRLDLLSVSAQTRAPQSSAVRGDVSHNTERKIRPVA